MTKEKSVRIIIDTNVWISYLIGKNLKVLTDRIISGSVQLIISDELIAEIEDVSQRPKIKKYFPKAKVEELLELLKLIAEHINIAFTENACSDPKDNFLLDMAVQTKADYLVTGDKDLLQLNPYKQTTILTASEFERVLI